MAAKSKGTNRPRQLRAVALFSGCGGLDLGLTKAGFRIDLAVDNDNLCAQSYVANFPQTRFVRESVENLTAKRLKEELGDTNSGEIDLLAGGPPCPPYSKSRFYRKEKPRALDDQLGKDTLHGYLKALAHLKPRAFLLENVPGFAYEIHRSALDLALDHAETLGYACSFQVLNAADYGVPQIRERFFLVGMLGGDKFVFPDPTNSEHRPSDLFGADLPPWETAGEAIGDLDTEENASDAGHHAGGRHNHLLPLIPPGQNYLFFTKERKHPSPLFKWRSRYWSFLLKLSPDLPSWTIQARRSNNMGPLHWRNRILRIEEVKRLQTFPDGWHLAGKVEEQWRQVGNAVPPALAYQLGLSLAAQLQTHSATTSHESTTARTPRSKRVFAGTNRTSARS